MPGWPRPVFLPAPAPCAYVCFCARARASRTESVRAAALYTHLYPRALRRVSSMRPPGPGFCPRATAPHLRPRPVPALCALRPGAACAACFFTPCPRPGPARPRAQPPRAFARARDAVPAAPRAGI